MKNLIFVVVAMALVGCGSTDKSTSGSAFSGLFDVAESPTRTAGSILGLWGAKSDQTDGTLDLRLKVESNRLILAGRCRFPDGFVSTVAVTSAVTVVGNTVTIAESKRDSLTRLGRLSCTVSFEAGQFDVQVNGHKAHIGGIQEEFTKITD